MDKRYTKIKNLKTMFLSMAMWLVFMTTGAQTTDLVPVKVTFDEVKIETVAETTDILPDVEIVETDISYEEQPSEEDILTEEEIELIALVTMAEAEGEPEEGKRLVIDTILNRVDSELSYFPDTVHDVVYQKNAFSSVWNGRVDRCYVMEEICQLVRDELQNRTNDRVLYFTAGGYGRYGTPVFNVANHYFCEA